VHQRFLIGLAVLGLAVAGCGSDGGGDGSTLSDDQSAAARSAIDAAAEDGVTLDEDCVNEVASQLSDEDAALAAADPDAVLSDAGEDLGLELLNCASEEDIIELFLAGIGETEGIDEDCAREALAEFDIRELITSASADEPPAALVQALVPCFPDGG
jgi:hypothetical protein